MMDSSNIVFMYDTSGQSFVLRNYPRLLLQCILTVILQIVISVPYPVNGTGCIIYAFTLSGYTSRLYFDGAEVGDPQHPLHPPPTQIRLPTDIFINLKPEH